jgi:hypothetical protein
VVADGTATGTPIAFIGGQFEFKSGYFSVQNIVLKKTDFYFPKGEAYKTLERLKKETLEDGKEQQPGSDLRQNADKSKQLKLISILYLGE